MLIKQCFCTETSSVSLLLLQYLCFDVFKLIENPFIKIKKELMLTNFTLAMYKIAEQYQCPMQYHLSLT